MITSSKSSGESEGCCKKRAAPALTAKSDAAKGPGLPSDFRNRLMQDCYVSREPSDYSARLEKALADAHKADLLWKKIHLGIKEGIVKNQLNRALLIQSAKQSQILNQDEVAELVAFEALRQEIIQVNEFSFDLDHLIV